MISWYWLIVAFAVGSWFGLFVAGLLRAAAWADAMMMAELDEAAGDNV